MLKRLTMGVGIVLLLGLAALASMIRIVPTPPAAPARQIANAPAPATPDGAWRHPVLLVPVQGVTRDKIVDTWGQSRADGARTHQATDIVAPGGTPVVAAAPGNVEKLFYSEGGGGITLYVRSPDRQWSYYYAHLERYAPGVVEGMSPWEGAAYVLPGDEKAPPPPPPAPAPAPTPAPVVSQPEAKGAPTPLTADEIVKGDAPAAKTAKPRVRKPKTTESTAESGAGKPGPEAGPKPADPDVVKKPRASRAKKANPDG